LPACSTPSPYTTLFRSEYSDMSMRTIARSSSNKKSANDLANSVLPTPVGPKNRNEPMGDQDQQHRHANGAQHQKPFQRHDAVRSDRKSTRLNSSHVSTS